MIIYVESNFVLQLALEQEEVVASEKILQSGELGKVTLAIPAYSLSEPFSRLGYRSVDWTRIGESLSQQIERQLSRSLSRQPVTASIAQLVANLAVIGQEDTDRLQSVVNRLLASARVITLDTTIMNEALSYVTRYSLTMQDALVFASVISDLKLQPLKEEKCFVSTNVKDFGHTYIKTELQVHNCRYIAQFGQAFEFLEGKGR